MSAIRLSPLMGVLLLPACSATVDTLILPATHPASPLAAEAPPRIASTTWSEEDPILDPGTPAATHQGMDHASHEGADDAGREMAADDDPPPGGGLR